MQDGWNAKGLLKPLWHQYSGGRDQLAADVGTSPTVLSSINTGKRQLGYGLGQRLAAALNVSLLELGAPLTGQAEPTLVSRLDELQHTLEEILDAVRPDSASTTPIVDRIEALARRLVEDPAQVPVAQAAMAAATLRELSELTGQVAAALEARRSDANAAGSA